MPSCPRRRSRSTSRAGGAHPADLRTVTFADCAESVRADVDAAGFDDFVLAGHSLAGCSMPAMIGLLGDRVRHAVFVACTVPETGKSAFDTLDPEVQAMAAPGWRPRATSNRARWTASSAKLVLGNDLTDEQFEFCLERLVPEAPSLPTARSTSRRCVPTCRRRGCARSQDMIVAAAQAAAVREERRSGRATCSISTPVTCAWSGKPDRTASILDEIAIVALSGQRCWRQRLQREDQRLACRRGRGPAPGTRTGADARARPRDASRSAPLVERDRHVLHEVVDEEPGREVAATIARRQVRERPARLRRRSEIDASTDSTSRPGGVA